MARTAPVPNMVAIPGMNPGLFVLGGGGDGGGSGDGSGDGKGGKQGANGKNGGKNAGEGGPGGKGCGAGKGSGCPNPAHGSGGGTAAGDPVDVATGQVFTVPAIDLVLHGPLSLVLERQYSSSNIERDAGLGFGWTHTFAWEIEERRRTLVLWHGDGTREIVEKPEMEQTVAISPSRTISREAGFFVIRDQTGKNLYFRPLGPDNRHVLFRVQDASDQRIELDHDDRGVLLTLTDSVFRVVRVRRHPDGRIAAFEVRNGPAGAEYVSFYSYYYDDQGDLYEVVDAVGARTRFRYQEHLLTEIVHADGLTVHHVYDNHARCVETWADYPGAVDPSLSDDVPATLADGVTKAKGVLHCKIEYHEDHREVIDSKQVRRYDVNEHLKVGKGVWGAGVWTNTYDQFGNITSSTDPENAMWEWRRDGAGRVTTRVDPMGNQTSLRYDASGNLHEIEDPMGVVVTYLHDARGNLVAARDALGDIVRYVRDGLGNLVQAELPNGGVTRMKYDAHGNRVEIVEPNGGVRRIKYDFLGRVVAHVDPAGGETRYTYHPTGRLRTVTHPTGAVEEFDHDPVGRVNRIRDANGRVFEMRWGGYDAIHEVVRPNGRSVKLRYDREGNLVSVTNEAGEKYRYERDVAGRIVAEHTFDGRTYLFKHDSAGRVLEMTNPAHGKWMYEYDAVGRLVKREHPDGSVDEFERDALGRLVVARTPRVTCEIDYDIRGSIVAERTLVDGELTSVAYENDLMGKTVALRSSLGFSERVERDLMGNPARIQFGDGTELRLKYDINNHEILRQLGGGGLIQTANDPLGLVTQRRVLVAGARLPEKEPEWLGQVPPGTAWQMGFTFSAGGELQSEHDPRRGSTRFEHDPLGQLKAVIPQELKEIVFGYDEVGNRKTAASEQYDPGGALVSRQGASYRYNAEGALVEKVEAANPDNPYQYTWSGAGLLEGVKRPDGCTLELVYDAFARRVLKRVRAKDGKTKTHRYVWSGDCLLHEVRREAGEKGDPVVEERTYCNGPSYPVPMAQRKDVKKGDVREAGTWEYIVSDANDTPRAVVSDTGQLLAEMAIDAWGKPTTSEPAPTPFRFPGHYEDEETGLFYNRYRYYDPEAGRYISPDPIRMQGSLRSYVYADNRPDYAIDLEGLQTIVTITRRDGSTIERSQGDEQPYHPAVQQALSPCTAHTAGAPRVQPETATTPESGGRRPGACAEPAALSGHLRDWESRNCPPQATCNPNTDAGRASLSSALGEIRPENGIAARDQQGRPMAPCANCSQTIPNLWAQTGPGARPPANVIAPGYPPQTISAMDRGVAPAGPPTQRFTPPQGSTPSYDTRLAAHNAANPNDQRQVNTWTPGGGWGSYTP